MRYGQISHLASGFSRRPGGWELPSDCSDSCQLSCAARPVLHSASHSRLAAHPVHSMGSPSLPRPRFTPHDALWCRTLSPAFHRLRLNVLGLGPDSPWVDWRCPGTLRHTVWMVLTSISLLIPAFALVPAPPVLAVRLLRCGGSHHRRHNAPLPMLFCRAFHSFGTMLEPRYVVGARALDQ